MTFSDSHASRYGRLVLSASNTSHTSPAGSPARTPGRNASRVAAAVQHDVVLVGDDGGQSSSSSLCRMIRAPSTGCRFMMSAPRRSVFPAW